MEERENANTARKMYIDLCTLRPTAQVYQRHIQFQVREKQWANAKNIFDTMLVTFQSDIELLSHFVVEYCDFVVKYYRDLDYPKKLLKSYFDFLPYNDYLFTNYLQFMKHFENKEGYYDELMQLIHDALMKARKGLSDDKFGNVIKMVKYYLRSTLSSIYLIKISERRMMEFEEKLQKETYALDNQYYGN